MAAVLALLSAAVFGAGDFAGGLASRRLPAAAVVLRSNVVGLAGLALAAPFFAVDALEPRDLAIGAGAGLIGGLGILLLYRGLAGGTMSVVAPITAVLSAAVPVVAGFVDGERPALLAIAGVPLAFVAIVLLSRDPDEEGPLEATPLSVVVMALVAGLCFGLFFVGLDRTGDGAGLWPLVAARGASVALFTAITAAHAGARVGSDAARRGDLPRLLVICGVCDSGANALFLLATHHGLLTLVAVLGSLYPLSTVVLATTITGERLARSQTVGVALALGGAALITAG